MPLQIIDTDVIAPLGDAVVLDQGDSAYVRAGVLVAAQDASGITGIGTNYIVTVAGAVHGSFWGIGLGDSGEDDQNARVTVTATGLVSGNVHGLNVAGIGGIIANFGQILGQWSGVNLMGRGTLTTTSVVNHGDIFGMRFGISRDSEDDTETIAITNHGTITGAEFAYTVLGAVGRDILVNRGLMQGNVDLGSGDDSFDGKGGTLLGVLDAGAGNDTCVASGQDDLYEGGGVLDTLDFRGAAPVTFALDGTLTPSGAAAGGSYLGFENINGSDGGDHIRGDDGVNNLFGRAGADTLSGGNGGDRLRGGNGADALSGGLGNDGFVFQSLAEFGDTISDFSSAAAGNNDRFLISAGIGGGLVAGALPAAAFLAVAGGAAADAGDRFIFDTTTRTLWFDADGTGVMAALAVATLQPGASMTAADIVIL